MQQLEVIGLGAGTIEQLTLGIYKKLRETKKEIYVRTKEHPVVESLHKEGIQLKSFDSYYEEATDFLTVYKKIAKKLVEKVKAGEHLIYAVLGHPMLAEKTVQLLLNEPKIEVSNLDGHRYMDDLLT